MADSSFSVSSSSSSRVVVILVFIAMLALVSAFPSDTTDFSQHRIDRRSYRRTGYRGMAFYCWKNPRSCSRGGDYSKRSETEPLPSPRGLEEEEEEVRDVKPSLLTSVEAALRSRSRSTLGAILADLIADGERRRGALGLAGM